MSATALAVVVHNASFLVEEGLERMRGRSASCEEALEFCTQLRRRGIAAVLLKGAPQELLRDLSWSGRAFLHVLPAIPDASRATGLQLPFFDAVAADDLACAAELARVSRATWNPREELEDDFLYVTLLMSFVLGQPGGGAATAAAARYRAIAAADEEADPRLGVCLSLLQRDAPAFDEALGRFLREKKARYRELAIQGAIPDEEAATEGSVSTEGLALVRIARAAGLAPRASYPMVPSLALRAPRKPEAPDAWMVAGG